MSTAQLLIGPLGPFEPDEDTHILQRDDGRWLVSERATNAPLRLTDANPSGKVQAWASPDSGFGAQLGVAPGRAELFSDGLLVAATAPGEWLALTPRTGAALQHNLRALAGADDIILVDRSAGLALFRLTGPQAPALLAESCADLGGDELEDGHVLSSLVAGVRCTIVRDDLLPEELAAGFDVDPDGPAAAQGDAPLVPSYLLVCDRSLARALHAQLLDTGARHGIETEGFARYRSYHRDV